MPAFLDSVKKVSPKGWAMIGGSVAVGIAFLMIVMSMASAPSYSTLMAGIDPSQTSKIQSTLSAQGISYQLQNNGTAIAVQPAQTAQARVALATAGLLTNQQPGFSLLNSSSLGQSNFQQQVTYQRALEGQLASTIQTINGVSSATVNLVLPNSQDQLFSSNTQSATASVLLGSSGLTGGQVRGIAQLVASSVPGLSVNKVTITGPDGSLLWPSSSSDGSSGGLLSAEAASQKYDSTMSGQVDAMLAQTLGAGKAQVVINANVNANQATSDTLIYAKKGVPLTQQTTTETLKGGNGTAAGAAGTAANIPAYATTGTGSGNSNYANKTTNTTFGVNKTVTHAIIAPGAINQQSVSLLVDKSVPTTELPALKAAVANAVGLQAKRGDTLSLGQLAFAKPAAATTPTAGGTSSYMKYAKYGVAGLGSIIFLVFAGRLLRRRERENFAGQPTWLRELEAPRTLASLERRQASGQVQAPEPTEVMALRSPVNVARRQVEDLVERDPERVAQQVRAWMSEE
ncbi:MAG TPA: flagellar basal-body MS-ring/collar protein FliF [Solirubrobacteraceae bacterium]|nr:flagellar basal-body MS-ring/collar protein FliF [Solirubrobacteraceae bacterium]